VEHEIWTRIAGQETHIIKKFYFRVLSRRIRRFEIASLNRYDMLVPITQRDLDHFHGLGNRKPAHVCPAALDADSCSMPRIPESLPSLFFLGSLEWRPNQEGLLWFTDRIFPGLLLHYPALRLHVAGRNAPDWLQKKLEIPGIVYHGEIPDSNDFIKAHDIMVAPCFSGGGMRVKIIEAMAQGKPVLTTPIGAEGLGTSANENILIGNSIVDFTEYLDRLIKYPDFYRRIGQSASCFIRKNFDDMKVSADLISFYISNIS
jgi:glycosyltransferase involved in cell wall biosynthesis